MFWFGNADTDPIANPPTSRNELTALQVVEKIIFNPVNQKLQSLKLQFRDWVENSAPQNALVSWFYRCVSYTNMYGFM